MLEIPTLALNKDINYDYRLYKQLLSQAEKGRQADIKIGK